MVCLVNDEQWCLLKSRLFRIFLCLGFQPFRPNTNYNDKGFGTVCFQNKTIPLYLLQVLGRNLLENTLKKSSAYPFWTSFCFDGVGPQ